MATGAKSARFARYALVGLTLFVIAVAVGIFAFETDDCLRWPAVNEFAPTRAKPFGYWIARDYQNTNPAPDILVFGDSQLGGLRSADAKVAGTKLDFVLDHRSYALESALETANFEKEPKTFIASQPGCLVSDYLVMAESLFSDLRKPKLVVLTVTPRVFLSNGLACPGNSQYYRYFASNMPLGTMYDLAFPSLGSKLHAVVQSMMRTPVSTVAPGKYVFLPNDRQVFSDALQMYPSNFSFSSKDCKHQIRFLEETLACLNKNKIRTIVVSMPMLKTESVSQFRLLQNGLAKEILGACETNDAEYLDITDDSRFTKTDFLDPIHLSQNGGEKFANILAEFISKMR
jgi:hypothetical protein